MCRLGWIGHAKLSLTYSKSSRVNPAGPMGIGSELDASVKRPPPHAMGRTWLFFYIVVIL